VDYSSYIPFLKTNFSGISMEPGKQIIINVTAQIRFGVKVTEYNKEFLLTCDGTRTIREVLDQIKVKLGTDEPKAVSEWNNFVTNLMNIEQLLFKLKN